MTRIAAWLVVLLCVAGCDRDQASKSITSAAPPPLGNAGRGKELAARYGCNVCHAIPGVEGPQGSLGPSLAGVASRPALSYNVVRNTPDNLARYIQNPQSLNPRSAMPPIGLSDDESRDIAAYLLTLE